MRAWFMVGALALGLIGIWGDQGRTGRGRDGTVTTQDDPNPIPTPRDNNFRTMDDPNPIPTPRLK